MRLQTTDKAKPIVHDCYFFFGGFFVAVLVDFLVPHPFFPQAMPAYLPLSLRALYLFNFTFVKDFSDLFVIPEFHVRNSGL